MRLYTRSLADKGHDIQGSLVKLSDRILYVHKILKSMLLDRHAEIKKYGVFFALTTSNWIAFLLFFKKWVIRVV